MYSTRGLPFNSARPTVMHIDLNSCFASVEQQSNPFWRGKPLAVAAYTTPSGCILAASIEAKRYGIKTGMRVKDGKKLYPQLIVVKPDPPKYRFVHKQIGAILANYTGDMLAKSIDEYVLRLAGYPILRTKTMHELGVEIKKRIKCEVGDWLKVSIGIAPSGFLAKTASNIKKPDGLEEINKENVESVYKNMVLTDIHGINFRNAARLNSVGIYTPYEFYTASLQQLKSAFRSINAFYWYVRLRGWDIDDVEFGRKSFGNSYSLPQSKGNLEELLPLTQKLIEKTGSRMRKKGYSSKGVQISLLFRDGSFWHKGRLLDHFVYDSRDIYKEVTKLLKTCPQIKPVHTLAESCFSLIPKSSLQLTLFEDELKKESLVKALDSINEIWGEFSVTPARMVSAKGAIEDRIAFGTVVEI